MPLSKIKTNSISNPVSLTTPTIDGVGYSPFQGFKNQIINGGMQIAQRGTSFTSNGYTLDRWTIFNSGGTFTLSQQTASPGAQPAAGLNNFMRVVRASPSGILYITQKIEDITKFDGAPTVTISFYAKATAAVTLPLRLMQEFGTGGSSSVTVSSVNNSLTTSWQRFTCVYNVPSLSGKTIGTSSYLESTFDMPVTTETIDITGVQLEFGSVPTSFEKRHIQQELTLCHRYYFNLLSGQSESPAYWGAGNAAQAAWIYTQYGLPVAMRTTPSPTLTSTSLVGLASVAAFGRGSNRVEIQQRANGSVTDSYWYATVFNVSAEI